MEGTFLLKVGGVMEGKTFSLRSTHINPETFFWEEHMEV